MDYSVSIILGIVIVYILGTMGISVWARKFAGTTSKFMVGNKDMGITVIAVLLMSEWIGTSATMGTAEIAFNKGISAAWNLTALFVAMILFSIMMAKKYRETGEHTISGLIAQKFGNRAAKITAVIMIYAMGVLNVQLYVGGAAILGTILHLPTNVAVWATALICIVYVTAGGMKSVAYTNLVHATFKYIGIIITTVFALQLSGGLSTLSAEMPAIYFTPVEGVGLTQIVAWMVGSVGAVFCTQYVIQAIGSTKDGATAVKASLLAGLLIIPIGLMASVIGIAAKYLYPNIKGLWAIPYFATHMHPVLGGIVISALMATVFGTVSATTLGATALIVRDFYTPWAKPDEKKKLIATRVIAAIFGLLPVGFALLTPEVIKTLFFARALRTSLSVVVVCMFYFPFFGSSRGVTASLLAAIVATTAWFLLGDPFGIDNVYIAILVPLVILIIDRLMGPPAPVAKAE
ncbi:MAG: sodium:solute symporter family protein [Negativicutes bacterium]|nr:sodium:solute symporter family protein [Negativicutes bacterium]